MTVNDAPRFSFDTASAINQGARDYQEDAIIFDFSSGADLNFVVLADGMGGHAAGDVASKIVVTEMFSKLTFRCGDTAKFKSDIPNALQDAAMCANDRLKEHVAGHPDTQGMGATLVSAVFMDGLLYWISVGDSPMYLFRDGALTQLNEDHSMAKTIDMMVQSGTLSEEEGSNHPDRNVLTSVLFGEPIPHVDCPAEPMQLQAGDTLIVASDGLQFLEHRYIEQVLRERPFSSSSQIADVLVSSLKKLNDPDLDNISLSVTQVSNARQDDFGLHQECAVEEAYVEKQSLFQSMIKSRRLRALRRESGPTSGTPCE